MDAIQIVDVELGKERPTALDSRNVCWSVLAADAVNLRCNHWDFADESSDSMLFAEIQPATQISFLGACFRGNGCSGFGRSKEDESENGMDAIQIVDVELGKERPTALDSRNVCWSILAADAANLRCNHEDFADESSDSMLFAEIQPATQISLPLIHI